MHNIYVKDIKKICEATILGNENIIMDNFSIDTRTIKKDDIYVGLKGDNNCGSDYYLDAIKKGAKACIIDKKVEPVEGVTIVIVKDTLLCLQKLAELKRTMYDIPVIAITGSSGKTSTKDIVSNVVREKYKTHSTIGNLNNHIGVPLTILSMKDEEVLVIEMGMNHSSELEKLSKIAKPTISIITNIGTAHIGNLGSRENILKAKLEILDGMIGNTLIINEDNDMLKKAKSIVDKKFNIVTFSINSESDYRAYNIKEDVFKSTFNVLDDEICINVGGLVFIYNALVAYIVGKLLNINIKDIKKGIETFKLSNSRLEKKITKNNITIIDDTYNANFDSMSSSIELLGKVHDKRKVAILGDMLELGEFTEKLHKDIGTVLLNNKIDLVITIGEYSKYINDIINGFITNYHFNKEYESYQLLNDILDYNDIVLIKGSHSIKLNNIVDYLMKNN